MNNTEKYQEIFAKVFPDYEGPFDESFTFASIEEWNSMTHLDLITKLEDAFDIMMDTNDILHFGSYENGLKILAKYGVEL